MTSIISREEQFLKINEQLDRMTKHVLEKPATLKVDSKFSTFTKKGPIKVFRQNEKGKTYEIPSIGLKERSPDGKEISTFNGARKKVLPKDRSLQGIVEEKKNFFERAAFTSPRSSGVKTLPLAKSNVSKNSSNIVVRYKNNSFTQSPSLEVLVKDENESVRSQARSNVSDFSGGSTTVRSKVNLSSEGHVKYLKSRIAILQSENETLTQEMSGQKDVVEKSIERQKKIENQRDLAYARNNALSEQMKKLEGQLEEALRRLNESSSEYNNTQKELELAKREIKVLTQTNANLEKRLYRTNEELENSRNTLNQMKSSEREMKESIRNENDIRDKQIKALKKQRADLLNAYKKQLYLIDNLKRQNLCMEQSTMIAFGEKEFTKVLDWQMSK